MNPSLAVFALAAMVPAMVDGALQHQPQGGVILALCSGGSMTLSSGAPAQPHPANSPCCAKGCRDSERRRKPAIDPGQ